MNSFSDFDEVTGKLASQAFERFEVFDIFVLVLESSLLPLSLLVFSLSFKLEFGLSERKKYICTQCSLSYFN